MSTFTRLGAVAGTTALLAVPATVLLSAPAHADVERHGACGGGSYEFSVDREGGGFEVSADVDNVQSGSKWRVVLRHDGKKILARTLRADHEGDLDVERFRDDSAGKDRFRFRAARTDGSASCSAAISVS
jgi:hypothetical protein